jgi:hypothetical protein
MPFPSSDAPRRTLYHVAEHHSGASLLAARRFPCQVPTSALGITEQCFKTMTRGTRAERGLSGYPAYQAPASPALYTLGRWALEYRNFDNNYLGDAL